MAMIGTKPGAFELDGVSSADKLEFRRTLKVSPQTAHVADVVSESVDEETTSNLAVQKQNMEKVKSGVQELTRMAKEMEKELDSQGKALKATNEASAATSAKVLP